MQERWLYYVPFVVQRGDKIGLSAKIVSLSHRIDSEETVIALINALTAEVYPDGPPDDPDGMLPVTPLGWVLVSAKRSSSKDNGKRRPTH